MLFICFQERKHAAVSTNQLQVWDYISIKRNAFLLLDTGSILIFIQFLLWKTCQFWDEDLPP